MEDLKGTSSQYAKMQTGEPYATYKKTQPGILVVRVLNPFSQREEELLLKGIPDKGDLTCYVPLWSDKEARFFEFSNQKALEDGDLIPAQWPKLSEIRKTYNNMTDEELTELVGPNTKFIKLQAVVSKMTTEAAVSRALRMAEQMDRPEKTVQFLRERLSQIQLGAPQQE